MLVSFFSHGKYFVPRFSIFISVRILISVTNSRLCVHNVLYPLPWPKRKYMVSVLAHGRCTAGSRKEGTGGREVKTKATKKKGRGRDVEEDSDDDGGATGGGGGSRQQETSFMGVKEIQEVLQSQDLLADCPDTLLRDIATQLHRSVGLSHRQTVVGCCVFWELKDLGWLSLFLELTRLDGCLSPCLVFIFLLDWFACSHLFNSILFIYLLFISDQGPVSWRPTTVYWRLFSQSNCYSTIDTRQTEYHETLLSLVNDEVRCDYTFAMMVTLHDTRFVECRWWNDSWTVKTVITWWSLASMIPVPDLVLLVWQHTYCGSKW